MKECDEEYNFDAEIVNDASCRRVEEGRPWRPHSPSSKKEGSSINANKTSDDKVTFERKSTSSKKKTLDLITQKQFRVIKHVETVNTSRWPGWRWANFYYRTRAW